MVQVTSSTKVIILRNGKVLTVRKVFPPQPSGTVWLETTTGAKVSSREIKEAY
jgi:hypothetical protein